ATPLTELVHKDTEFTWDQRQNTAFQRLKQLISEAPALHPINYESEQPIYLSVDSSNITVVFILSQDDKNGK
ncbi:hypothetical protein NEOLEDRAFT_1066984, partial [Neolentinus lepideus HHB14362 ss-1]